MAVINGQETERNCPMNNNNLYQEAEELVFKKHPDRYRLDIQSDRLNHKDTRLLQQHTKAVETEADKIEKNALLIDKISTTIDSKKSSVNKNLHSNLPPNPIDQAVPHGIDLDWN